MKIRVYGFVVAVLSLWPLAAISDAAAELDAAVADGFVFGSKGLMYNLTLEGSKITEIDKT